MSRTRLVVDKEVLAREIEAEMLNLVEQYCGGPYADGIRPISLKILSQRFNKRVRSNLGSNMQGFVMNCPSMVCFMTNGGATLVMSRKKLEEGIKVMRGVLKMPLDTPIGLVDINRWFAPYND